MKVMVASSFHYTSTRDVYMKAVSGLKACGVDVVPYDLTGRAAMFSFLEAGMKRSKKMKIPKGFDVRTMAYEILIGAVVFHDCEWLLVTSPQYFPSELAHMLRRIGIKTAALWTECPYEDTIHSPITASAFDVSFVNDLNSVTLFETFCPVVEYLPHSYDPELHYLPREEEREENIIFIGTGYNTRVAFMKKVEWPVRLDLYGFWPSEWLRYDMGLRQSLRSKDITTREQTADLYRKAAASFSIHRSMRYVGSDEAIMEGEAYSLGPRNWELAACGTWQISDRRQELEDVFGDTVPIYETPDDFSALMRKAFAEPGWRRELTAKQRERALPYSCHRTMRTVAQVLAA